MPAEDELDKGARGPLAGNEAARRAVVGGGSQSMTGQGTSEGGLPLSETERGRLQPVARLLEGNREELLAASYRACSGHTGGAARLGEEGLTRLLEPIAEGLLALLRADGTGASDERVRSDGAELAGREISFELLVACCHGLVEALLELTGAEDGATGRALTKLSHHHLAVLGAGYFETLPLPFGPPGAADETMASAVAEQTERSGRFGMVGRSAPMQTVYRQVEAAAQGRGPVFIVGETGSGKELAARAVHRCSEGAGSLVVVNCATLPRELVESELFGHRKGAYTGADQAYGGLVRAAAGSILFLDEITEMATEIQAKLLRVLEEGAVRPVGTVQEIAVDVRFMASTNRDPQKAIRAGVLREDIYYRLNVHRIEMPPLRRRQDDIAELVDHFLELLADRGMRRAKELEPEALAALGAYPWPGNVRELRNAVEVALAATRRPTIPCSALPPALRKLRPQGGSPDAASPIPTIEQAERQLIERALAATGGNKRRAADLLGISRHRLYDRLRRFEVSSALPEPADR